jgi:hypothetical protein
MGRRNPPKGANRTQLEDTLRCGKIYFNKDTEQERATRIRLHKLICKKCQSDNKNYDPVELESIIVALPEKGRQDNRGSFGKRYMSRNGIDGTTKITPIAWREE